MRVLDASGRWATVQASAGFLEGGDGWRGSQIELIGSSDGTRQFRSYAHVYRANPWLWACVNLLARSMARFPMKVYRQVGEESERLRGGGGSRAATLARALERPGNGRSQKTLVHSTMVDRLVNGNGVWFTERDRVGNYLGFTRVPWKYVGIEEIAGVERYWDIRRPNVKRLADDVVHFGAALDCDELINPSPIAALSATLALYDAVERHLVAFFKNNARPGAHLEVDKTTGKTAVELIRAELTKLYSGPENAGKVLVTSGKFSPMQMAPDNTKVIELAKQSREEICAAYGIPPPMVGILDRAIMSNVRELRSHLARDVVGGHTALFEGDVDSQVIARDPLLGDIVMEFEMSAYLKPDLESRAATWKNQRYVKSLNEIRRTENLGPIDHPDADVPWMPLNEAPLGGDNAPGEETDEDDEGDLFTPQEDD